MSIQEIVNKLPGLYQKVYKHPEYDNKHSRQNCDDRLELIKKLVNDYKPDYKVKILDIGCSHGYFCFNLDELGVDATGIDSHAGNIELNLAINKEQNRNVKFETQTLNREYAESLPDGHFDFIFLFSVIHHVCLHQGYKEAKEIVKILSRKTKFMIAEIALKSEKNYNWVAHLHEDPMDILDSFGFVRKIADIPTHLTEVKRPFYICSTEYCYVNNKYYKFNEYKDVSHDFDKRKSDKNKRYYFSENLFIKQCPMDSYYKNEFNAEVNILKEYNGKINWLPKLIDSEIANNTGFIIREKKEGILLSTAIKDKVPYNPEDVIEDILTQLAELESNGLYFHDLRTWNVIIDSKGYASLIDYGSINATPKQMQFHQLLTFVFDIMTRNIPLVATIIACRRGNMNYTNEKIKNIVTYIASKSESELSFSDILSKFKNEKPVEISQNDYIQALMNNYTSLENNFNFRIEELSNNYSNVCGHVEKLYAIISNQEKLFAEYVRNAEQILTNHSQVITSLDKDVAEHHKLLEILAQIAEQNQK